MGFFLTAFYLLQSLVNGRKARNPWGGASLEWECNGRRRTGGEPTPEYCYNFDHWV